MALYNNNSGEISKIGLVVVTDPKNPKGFIYAQPSSTSVLGIVNMVSSKYSPCEIATQGITRVFCSSSVTKGSTLRLVKTGDNLSRATCTTAKATDVPYFKIGTALESGKGLVRCSLEFAYITSLQTGSFQPAGNYQPLDADLTRLADYRRIGGDTNYTSFETHGHQEMTGTARPWRDEIGDALSLQVNGVGLAVDISELVMNFAYNAAYNANPALADFLYKNVQLNHDKDLTASIYPHIHWFQAKNYTPNLMFDYRWQTGGGAKTTAWTPLKCDTLAYTYTAGTLNQISYSVPIAVPAGTSLSDIVQFRIYRDSGNVSTLFAGACPYNTGGNASVGVLSFDCHFMINSLGSDDEYIK